MKICNSTASKRAGLVPARLLLRRRCGRRPVVPSPRAPAALRRRGKVRTAHPGLTARSRSAPLPLLSQMDPLRWAPFGSLFSLCLVVLRGGLSRRGEIEIPLLD